MQSGGSFRVMSKPRAKNWFETEKEAQNLLNWFRAYWNILFNSLKPAGTYMYNLL
jgi:hypothetical protein